MRRKLEGPGSDDAADCPRIRSWAAPTACARKQMRMLTESIVRYAAQVLSASMETPRRLIGADALAPPARRSFPAPPATAISPPCHAYPRPSRPAPRDTVPGEAYHPHLRLQRPPRPVSRKKAVRPASQARAHAGAAPQFVIGAVQLRPTLALLLCPQAPSSCVHSVRSLRNFRRDRLGVSVCPGLRSGRQSRRMARAACLSRCGSDGNDIEQAGRGCEWYHTLVTTPSERAGGRGKAAYSTHRQDAGPEPWTIPAPSPD